MYAMHPKQVEETHLTLIQLMQTLTPDMNSVKWNNVDLRGMVTLKCWGSEINSFFLSSFKPTPVGPGQNQMCDSDCAKHS